MKTEARQNLLMNM